MTEELLHALREWGFGLLALLIVGLVLYRMDRLFHALEAHAKSDEQFHGEIRRGQGDLVERVEGVRLAGENHAEEASKARRCIHRDVSGLGERLARLEGKIEEREK